MRERYEKQEYEEPTLEELESQEQEIEQEIEQEEKENFTEDRCV